MDWRQRQMCGFGTTAAETEQGSQQTVGIYVTRAVTMASRIQITNIARAQSAEVKEEVSMTGGIVHAAPSHHAAEEESSESECACLTRMYNQCIRCCCCGDDEQPKLFSEDEVCATLQCRLCVRGCDCSCIHAQIDAPLDCIDPSASSSSP